MRGVSDRLRFAIVVTGLQNLGDAVEFSVTLGVHSYVTVNDNQVMRGQYSKAVCCWHCLIGWIGLTQTSSAGCGSSDSTHRVSYLNTIRLLEKGASSACQW